MPGAGATGSEVYRITSDGSPQRLWQSRTDLVYALAFDDRGRLLAGTGNRGVILSLQGEREFTDLLRAGAAQVTGFARAPNGGLYVSTSNMGKVFLLGRAPAAKGSYESDVFDARTFSRWGRAEVRGTGSFELWARSGNVENPNRDWSPWTRVDFRQGTPLAVPPARFVQWKAVLHAGTPPPEVESVTLNYLPKNIAPVIDEVAVSVGERLKAQPRTATPENLNASPGSQPSPAGRPEPPPPAAHDQDAIAVRWAAHDDNDDQLMFSVYYRGDGETTWKLLKDRLLDKFYSFDASLLPDGGYTIKVVASDALSNSPDAALQDERESQHFEVDTTPPRVESLKAVRENGKWRITFRAVDNFSPIQRAEYAIDAGDWQFIEPVGRVSDALTENYDFAVPAPSAGEHLFVVRVWDRFENMGSAKVVVPGRR